MVIILGESQGVALFGNMALTQGSIDSSAEINSLLSRSLGKFFIAFLQPSSYLKWFLFHFEGLSAVFEILNI